MQCLCREEAVEPKDKQMAVILKRASACCIAFPEGAWSLWQRGPTRQTPWLCSEGVGGETAVTKSDASRVGFGNGAELQLLIVAATTPLLSREIAKAVVTTFYKKEQRLNLPEHCPDAVFDVGKEYHRRSIDG